MKYTCFITWWASNAHFTTTDLYQRGPLLPLRVPSWLREGPFQLSCRQCLYQHWRMHCMRSKELILYMLIISYSYVCYGGCHIDSVMISCVLYSVIAHYFYRLMHRAHWRQIVWTHQEATLALVLVRTGITSSPNLNFIKCTFSQITFRIALSTINS